MRQEVYTKLAEAVEARRYMKIAQEMQERSKKRRSMLRTFLHDTGVGTIAGTVGAGTLGALSGLTGMRGVSRFAKAVGQKGPSFKDYANVIGRSALQSGIGGAVLGGAAGAGVGLGRGAMAGV